MIKLLTAPEQPAVSEDTPFGCKIKSLAYAYGTGKIAAQFWSQDGGTVIAKLDDAAMIEESAQTDWDEVSEFLRPLGLSRISCTESAAQALRLPVSSRGEIMVLHPKQGKPLADVVINPGPREVYSLLEQARTETFIPPEFESFYMDLSYRTRHGAALTAGVRQGGRLAACAVCMAMTENTAVVSGVACLPELRRRGYASTAVCALTNNLKRQNIYIFRADGENESFYRKIGFQPYGNWSEITFQN